MAKSEIHLGRTAEAPSILDFITIARALSLRFLSRHTMRPFGDSEACMAADVCPDLSAGTFAGRFFNAQDSAPTTRYI
jgi:hypothetical protein